LALTSDDAAIETAALSAFRFLVERGGSAARLARSTATTLAYRWPTHSIEVELDWQEWAVFVLLTDAAAGSPGYYLDPATGHRRRMHVLTALEELGLVDGGLATKVRGAQRGTGASAMLAQIAMFSGLLRERVDAIAAAVPELLAGTPPSA
jgi:hypothetical protein